MDSLQELMEWNLEFAKRVFPKHCRDPKAPLHHLKEEVEEIIEAIETKSREETLEEYADALILLTGSAIRLGFSSRDLINASFDKMKKNEKRDWGEPDENGVYNHKKITNAGS
jgi:NTP pyrophosphatase (non-canonical NTP hydrolase)